MVEAEAYPGPALVIAYSHCIAHGIDTFYGHGQQKLAVETGYWPPVSFRTRAARSLGRARLLLTAAKRPRTFGDFIRREGRYASLMSADRRRPSVYWTLARKDILEQGAFQGTVEDSLTRQASAADSLLESRRSSSRRQAPRGAAQRAAASARLAAFRHGPPQPGLRPASAAA